MVVGPVGWGYAGEVEVVSPCARVGQGRDVEHSDLEGQSGRYLGGGIAIGVKIMSTVPRCFFATSAAFVAFIQDICAPESEASSTV